MPYSYPGGVTLEAAIRRAKRQIPLFPIPKRTRAQAQAQAQTPKASPPQKPKPQSTDGETEDETEAEALIPKVRARKRFYQKKTTRVFFSAQQNTTTAPECGNHTAVRRDDNKRPECVGCCFKLRAEGSASKGKRGRQTRFYCSNCLQPFCGDCMDCSGVRSKRTRGKGANAETGAANAETGAANVEIALGE